MPVLEPSLKAQLNSLMDRVTQPVELVVSLDGREQSTRMKSLLDEVAALSSQITVRRDDAAHQRTPAFSIAAPGSAGAITFAALPLGHEFSSFVLALLQVGGNPVKLDERVAAAVKGLDRPLHFLTYISLSCQNCPTVVQALNAMSVLNPLITSEVVDGSLFREEVEAKKVLATPTIYLNGEPFGQGRMEAAQILARIDESAASSLAAGLAERAPYQVLVVGQGPAGVSAAIYLARKGIRTGLVGERFGGQVNDTLAIENLISVPHTDGPKLAADLRAHASAYEIDIIDGVKATELVPGEQVEVKVGDEASLRADAVVLATGARWRHMNVPGEDEYRNKGVTYCPHCDGPLFKGKDVAVIGGGNSGAEAALDLAGVARHVTVLEFAPTCKADQILLDRLDASPNVDILTNAAASEVVGDGSQVTALRYTDRASGQPHELALDGIFVQIGLVPNTEWLKGVVGLDNRGQIVVDAKGATDVPRVFAAGDCTDVPYKQIVVATGAGATAGLSSWESLIRTAVPQSPVQASRPATAIDRAVA
ncbi:alkyl hydroperoxide reductase subunit F [Propionibacterium cyclohexanicum]|uniref:Alkyl hydroperoxide reductase subunit F n=1 Tax=Propionibacterium cyclohexanicum TaxID=64702 RepID=A0A1H9TAL2_9ACTN|nr:alkyl hydroperoxide reductase subunit F [Propionibacterium cyclohexanicum]SER94191.1 alkyl hydroperoxide reductase subunit F [Propionibacterium cyclohexanicum]